MKKIRIAIEGGSESGLEYTVLGEDNESMCLKRAGFMYFLNKKKNKLYSVECNGRKTIKDKVLSIEVVEQ